MRRSRRLTVLVLAVSALAFVRALAGGFVYDDQRLLVQNDLLCRYAAGVPAPDGSMPLTKMLRADFAKTSVRRGGTEARIAIDYFRPVVVWSYALDTTFWGEAEPGASRGASPRWTRLNPVGFHLTNLLVHLVNVALVLVLMRRLGASGGASAAIALLFGVHPVHTENVAWIAGRTDLLATACFLAAMLAYVGLRRRRSRGGAIGWSVALYTLALFGVFAKEMTATLGLILVLVEWFGGGRLWKKQSGFRRWLPALACFATIPVYFAVKRALGVVSGDPSILWADVSLPTIAASFARAVGWYVSRIVWPHPPNIDPIVPFANVLTGLWSAVAVAALVVFAGRRSTRAPLVLLGVVAFLASLLPLSCIVPGARLLRLSAETQFPVAERFLYLPSVFALAAIVATVAASPLTVLAKRGLTGIAVLAALIGTVVQVGDWRTDRALFERATATEPTNGRMHMNLGLTLLADGRGHEAEPHLRESLDIWGAKGLPLEPLALRGLAGCADLDGRHEDAVRLLRRAVEVRPSPEAESDLAFSLAITAGIDGDVERLREAIRRFGRVLEARPDFRAAAELNAVLEQILVAWIAPESERTAARRLASHLVLAKQCETTTPPRRLEALKILDRGRRSAPAAGSEHDGPTLQNVRTRVDQAWARIATVAKRDLRARLERDPSHETARTLLRAIGALTATASPPARDG